MWHVRTTQRNSSDLRNSLEPGVHVEVGDFIRFSIDQERFRLDIMSLFPTFPAFDRTNNDKLSWTLTAKRLILVFDLS